MMARFKWFVVDVLILLAAWSLIAALVPEARYVLPPISVVAHDAHQLLASGALVSNVLASARRMVEGFLLAVCTALPLGLLLGSNPKLLKVADPAIEVVRPISPIAWIPLSILWFGIGEASKVFIVWLIVFFFILLNTIGGVLAADKRLIEAARSLGASHNFVWRKVIIWEALPHIMIGLRLGIGVSIGGVVIAEMVAAKAGIGFMMESARVVLNPGPVIVGMVIIAGLGYGANHLLVAIERTLMHYRTSVELPRR